MTVSTIGKKEKQAILVVSFGTSCRENLEKTIGAVERGIAQAFPDYEIRRAFTSPTIIKILEQRENLKIDSLKEALERLKQEGYSRVILQPTYIIGGMEYNGMLETATCYGDIFESFSVGEPLLSTDRDYEKVVEILTKETEQFRKEQTAVVFMGHGTEHEANKSYVKLQQCFMTAGRDDYIIGTVEARPSIGEVMKTADHMGVKNTVLLPFMVVAGDHANNDMAGDDEDSWKNLLAGAGFDVKCVMKGIGEYKGIQDLFIEHIKTAFFLKV